MIFKGFWLYCILLVALEFMHNLVVFIQKKKKEKKKNMMTKSIAICRCSKHIFSANYQNPTSDARVVRTIESTIIKHIEQTWVLII